MKLLIITFLLASCSSIESSVPMENRKYDMCVDKNDRPTFDGFCHQGSVCVKRFIGICINKEIQVIDKIEVEFKDKVEAEKLFHMNFVLQVREKPL